MKKVNQIIQKIIQLTTLSKSNDTVLYNTPDEIPITVYDKEEKLFALKTWSNISKH
jgi:hypothetical protein